jgi:TusA-related sulfurtransferase
MKEIKTMADLKSMTPVETLDVLGRVCPYPIVSSRKKWKNYRPGAILKVLRFESTAEKLFPIL